MISRVKGTQDLLDLKIFNYIIDTVKKTLKQYHFTEISTPVIEPLSLFVRSLGEQTDVITKEMFIIDSGAKEDKIALRPEATASTVRAFVENGIQTTPWKVFSWGPMFRHERPQKGRYRQFNQVTIEVIGAASISYDVALITMLDRMFHEKFQLNTYALLINFLGCRDDREAFKHILHAFLMSDNASGICDTCVVRRDKNILRVFDCKNSTCQKIYETAPKIAEHLCESCAQEWQTVRDQLDLLSVTYAYKPTLVRGLDYYNKTVFEFVSSNLGAQNAFCAGGRYDSLVKEVGGKHDQPSVGAAIGIERVELLLQENPAFVVPSERPLNVIVPLSHEQYALALLLGDTLIAAGLSIDIIFGTSVKSMMRKANAMHATYVLVLGEQEQQDGTVVIKNMMTGQQVTVAQTAAAASLS